MISHIQFVVRHTLVLSPSIIIIIISLIRSPLVPTIIQTNSANKLCISDVASLSKLSSLHALYVAITSIKKSWENFSNLIFRDIMIYAISMHVRLPSSNH